MPSLEVAIAGLSFKNPVLIASGTCGYGLEYAPYIDLNRLGGIVVKGISLEPQPGNPPPRIIETPGIVRTPSLTDASSLSVRTISSPLKAISR